MERIRGILSVIGAWVESHALGVGVAGLAALVVGGGLGIAGLTAGESTPPTTTASSIPPAVASTTSDPGEPSATTEPSPGVGAGSTFFAVRIDNAPEAQPQIGLQEAALVIETPVEGGMTRFTAMYEPDGVPELVGPVRSLRPVDVDLIVPFASTVVATGGRPFVLQEYEGSGMVLALPDTAPGFTALERPSPHNLFVRLSDISSVYPARPTDEPGLPEGELASGEAATEVTVSLPVEVAWQFSESGYSRSEGGEPFEVLSAFEGQTEPYAVDTVVVLFAAQRPAGYTDANDVDVPTFDVIGSGRLLVFNGGEVTEGTWFRSAQEDAYRFFDVAGSDIGIPPGRTHLMVVPRELQLDY